MKRIRPRAIAARLADGSATVYRRRADALAGWVAAGRRDDLDGWRAVLGPLLRLAALALATYVIYAAVRAVPWLMWLLTAWWARTAWRSGQGPVQEPEDTPTEEPAASGRDAVVALLLECLGDRHAVHLSTVLAHLQEKGQCKGWKVTDLRARLEALGIRVDPKVKVGGVPTRGVRRADLAAPPQGDVAGEPKTPSPAV